MSNSYKLSGGGWNTHEIPEPRWFDKVEVLTSTLEADTLTIPPEQLSRNSLIITAKPAEKDGVDILIYQEEERAIYLQDFQAPTERSYWVVENINPVEDEINIGLAFLGPPEFASLVDNTPTTMFYCGDYFSCGGF